MVRQKDVTSVRNSGSLPHICMRAVCLSILLCRAYGPIVIFLLDRRQKFSYSVWCAYINGFSCLTDIYKLGVGVMDAR